MVKPEDKVVLIVPENDSVFNSLAFETASVENIKSIVTENFSIIDCIVFMNYSPNSLNKKN
jgi:hypothetical protein|tara:strand:+ start:978 stop:1160 length:183 start_codon:yes stop_codon:yes gene_type:complete